MPVFMDLTGRIFGRLRVIGVAGKTGEPYPKYLWKCACGCWLVAREDSYHQPSQSQAAGIRRSQSHRGPVGREIKHYLRRVSLSDQKGLASG